LYQTIFCFTRTDASIRFEKLFLLPPNLPDRIPNWLRVRHLWRWNSALRWSDHHGIRVWRFIAWAPPVFGLELSFSQFCRLDLFLGCFGRLIRARDMGRITLRCRCRVGRDRP